MAEFNFNVTQSSSFFVELDYSISTDCASQYRYKITSTQGNSITIKLEGDWMDNSFYEMAGSVVSWDGSLQTVTLQGEMYVKFAIDNSANPGVFNEVKIKVTDATDGHLFEDVVFRENDSLPCDNPEGRVRTYDDLEDTPVDKVGSAGKFVKVSSNEEDHEYANLVIADITDFVDNSSDWDEAYSWGDHSLEGYELQSNKGVASGYVPLNSASKIPSEYLPAIALVDTFVVSSQSAMLSLTSAEQGDVAIRTDESTSYILQGNDSSQLSNWQELLSPTDAVQSVNGLNGTVVIDLNFSNGDLSITGGSSIDLDARYLQSFTETNDLSSNVTWVNVPDANITESSIVQHEGAITITESQISDLNHFTPGTLLSDYNFVDNSDNWNEAYGWGDHANAGYLTSQRTDEEIRDVASAQWINGTNTTVVKDDAGNTIKINSIDTNTQRSNSEIQDIIDDNTAGFITEYIVTEADVTQHETALTITESQISDLQHVTNNNQLLNGAGYITSFTDTQRTDEEITDLAAGQWIDGVNTTVIKDDANNTLKINAVDTNTQLSDADIAALGYIKDGNTNWNNSYGFVTSSGNTIIGTDDDINTTGALVIGQLNMTDGVIESHSVRTLTLANLGYTGDTNANNITNNNQLANGAGYITSQRTDEEIRDVAAAQWVDGTNTTVVKDDAGNTIKINSVDTNTQLSDAEIAAMGYIKTESDDQTLSIVGHTISLTDGGSVTVPDNNTQLSDSDISAFGYIKDYTVTQSDVTQHQSALTITESQISDLTHFSGDYNDLSNLPTIPSVTNFVEKTGDAMTGALSIDKDSLAVYLPDGGLAVGTITPVSKIEIDYSTSLPNNINSDVNSWNNDGKSSFSIKGNNNRMAFGVDGTQNTRVGFIQVGHSSNAFANLTDSKLLLQPYGGNVGIGTASPDSKLTLQDGDISLKTAVIPEDTPVYIKRTDSGQLAPYVSAIGFQAKSDSDWRGITTFNRKENSAFGDTSTVESMRIDETGNVGIGTDNPLAKLHVYSDGLSSIPTLGSTGHAAQIGASTYGTLFGTLNTGEGYIQQGRVDGTAIDYDLLLQPNGGNVGIGTDSPSAKLEVKEYDLSAVAKDVLTVSSQMSTDVYDEGLFAAKIRTYSNYNSLGGGSQGGLLVQAGFSRNIDIARFSSIGSGFVDVPRLVIKDTGNVGIGTDSPSTPLTIKSNSISSANSGLSIVDSTDTNTLFHLGERSNKKARFHMYNQGVEGIAFYTDGTDNHISYGNLGIGTTSPTEKLEVNGNIKLSGDINLSDQKGLNVLNGNATSIMDFDFPEITNVAGAFRIGRGTNTTSTLSTIFYKGNEVAVQINHRDKKLGIGKNPTANLDVTGNAVIDGAGTALSVPNGNVGIGNTSPSEKLEVNGNVKADDFILSSDKNLKENIKDFNKENLNINVKTYELKSAPGVKRTGVIAQELEVEHPEFVRTNDKGVKSVAYIDLLMAKIAELEARLEKLEK